MISDQKRYKAAQELFDAAYRFWNACQEEGQHGAVQWLNGSLGELIVFTRGEYRDTILKNIQSLYEQENVHIFSESLPTEEE